MLTSGLTLAEDGTVQVIEDVASKIEAVGNGSDVNNTVPKELFAPAAVEELHQEQQQPGVSVDNLFFFVTVAVLLLLRPRTQILDKAGRNSRLFLNKVL
jgi:hypothetical protein